MSLARKHGHSMCTDVTEDLRLSATATEDRSEGEEEEVRFQDNLKSEKKLLRVKRSREA